METNVGGITIGGISTYETPQIERIDENDK
jgi:hypothetical protein